MKERIITAIILFIIFIVVVALDIFVVNFVIFAIILVLAVWESLKLYGIKNNYIIVVSLLFFAVIPFFTSEEPFSIETKVAVIALIVITSFLTFIKAKDLKLVMPFLYPAIPLFLMFATYNDLGIEYLVWLVLTVSFSDIGALFVGKAIGRTKFSKTSPNKTVEGLIGGLILSIIVSYIYGKFFLSLSSLEIILTTLLIAVFGIFGDLFESYLKRQANVKDSGTILPGHGGVLDRIDGYLFGSIAMFLVFAW